MFPDVITPLLAPSQAKQILFYNNFNVWQWHSVLFFLIRFIRRITRNKSASVIPVAMDNGQWTSPPGQAFLHFWGTSKLRSSRTSQRILCLRVQWPLLVPVLGPVALCEVDPSLIFFEQHKEVVDVNFFQYICNINWHLKVRIKVFHRGRLSEFVQISESFAKSVNL